MKRAADNIADAAVSCGCGLLFLSVGLLPLLALLNVLPRAVGGRPSLLPVLGGFSFAGVGLYFIVRAITLLAGGSHFLDRGLLHVGLFFLAVPLHYWLFFGKTNGGRVAAGINLPGGFPLLTFDPGPLSSLPAKVALGALLLVVDVYLVSAFFRLGRSVLNSEQEEE